MGQDWLSLDHRFYVQGTSSHDMSALLLPLFASGDREILPLLFKKHFRVFFVFTTRTAIRTKLNSCSVVRSFRFAVSPEAA